MPLKPEMTWEKSKLRWRKMYRGKVYTVSCEALGAPATKEASYRAANAWWQGKRAEVDAAAPTHPQATLLGTLATRRDWARRHDDPEVAENLSKQMQRIESGGEPFEEWKFQLETYKSLFGLDPGDTPPELLRHLFDSTDRMWDDRLAVESSSPVVPDDLTVGGQVEAWLANQEAKVHAGQISPGQHNNVRFCLHHFRDFLGTEIPVKRIVEAKLGAYYVNLIGDVAERRKDPDRKAGMSRDYAAKHFAVARKFVRYLWSMGLVELPKNIDSKEFTFRKAPRSVPTMTKQEVRILIQVATGQLKLHLMLMANCGMTQADIAELKDGEVDWESGRIIRKRSKTDDHEDVPVVNYKLWTETFRLLKQYRSGQETVLLTRNGTVWAWESIIDGKYRSNDSIATNYNHLKAKLKKADKAYFPKPLKLLRKTSATLIESHEHYGRYVPHFLGHSPRTIKDKNYAAPSVELFDRIVGWLGTQYGFEI